MSLNHPFWKKATSCLGLVWLILGGLVEGEALSMDQAVARALVANVDYQTSLLAVDQANNSLWSGLDWKAVSVGVTRSQTLAPAAASTSVGVELPLWDQLGASGTVDQEGNTKVTITATPLAHSTTAEEARIAYQKALVTAEETRTTLETAVRKSYLTLVVAEAKGKNQGQLTGLKETAYLDAKAQYAHGSVTLAEVRAALKDWTEARTTQTTLEKAAVLARAELSSWLQVESVEVVSPSIEGLQTAVEALGPDTPSTTTPASVRLQALAVEAARLKADSTWLVDPTVVITGSAAIPAARTSPTWSGTVSVKWALGDLQATERTLAERTAALAVQGWQAEKTAAQAQSVQALLGVKAARDTVETRALALVQAQELAEETQLLAKSGAATALELDEALLGVTSAQTDLLAAWIDLYGAKLDLQ